MCVALLIRWVCNSVHSRRKKRRKAKRRSQRQHAVPVQFESGADDDPSVQQQGSQNDEDESRQQEEKPLLEQESASPLEMKKEKENVHGASPIPQSDSEEDKSSSKPMCEDMKAFSESPQIEDKSEPFETEDKDPKSKTSHLNEAEYTRIFREKGYRIVYDPQKDGNCQFTAIAWALLPAAEENPTDDEINAAADGLRQRTVDYIEVHPADFEGSMYDGVSLDEYITKMRDDGEYGDHLTLQAASIVLKRIFKVIQTSHPEADTINIYPDNQVAHEDHPDPILLGHVDEHHGMHYVCIDPNTLNTSDVNSSSARVPLGDSQLELPQVGSGTSTTDLQQRQQPTTKRMEVGPDQHEMSNIHSDGGSSDAIQIPPRNFNDCPNQPAVENQYPVPSLVLEEPLGQYDLEPHKQLAQEGHQAATQIHGELANDQRRAPDVGLPIQGANCTEDQRQSEPMRELQQYQPSELEIEIIERVKTKRKKENLSEEISARLLGGLQRMLIDHEIGKVMLKSLKDLEDCTTADLKSFFRIILTEIDIDDVEIDCKGVAERRYGWIQKAIKRKGHGLTPEYLLNIRYSYQILRDKMIQVFIDKLENCSN